MVGSHERKRGGFVCLLFAFGWMVGGITPSGVAAQGSYSVLPILSSAGGERSSAQPTGHGVRVSIDVRDSTVLYVVQALTKRAHLQMAYKGNEPALKKRVSVHVENADILDALAMALQGTGLTATLSSTGGTVLLEHVTGHGRESRQERTGIVRGYVADSASGKGVSDVTVAIAGTKLSTLTNESGEFVLRGVPVGTQLVTVKLFGYKPASRTVTVVDSGRVTVRFILTPTATILSGVVTTATGQQRKLSVGNDITTLNVDSLMQVAPITSVTDLLETRVPGLTVLHTSGTPGDPARIRLRGASSITGNNDPIVIVDGVRVYSAQSDTRNQNLAPSHTGGSASVRGHGVSGGASTAVYAAPSPLDQIDPNNIETIEVFKGPSASAMYGSDAANGVIVITTKQGRAGPTHWDMALGAGFSFEPGNWPVHYYRFGYGPTSAEGSPFCAWNDLGCTEDSVVAYQALNDRRYSVFADHGNTQNLSATFSGGGSALRYAVTGTATGDVGILKLPGIEQQRYLADYGTPTPNWMTRPDNYKTYGVSGQFTTQPATSITVTLNSSLYHSSQQRSSMEQGVTQLEGEYINPELLGTSPLIEKEYERATDDQLNSTNALRMNWQPLQWLPITAMAGINTIQRTDEAYTPYGINDVSYGNDADTTGFYGLGRGTSVDKTLYVSSTIPLRVISLAVGGNYHSGSVADFQASTNALAPGVGTPTTFPTGGVVGGHSIISTFSQSRSAASTFGWYLEPRLNLRSRFFVAPGFRLDGGSASGASGGFLGGGLTGFPKVDFSWVAVDESNAKGPLTMLRPRVAFGYAGTQPAPGAKLRLINGETSSPSVINLNGTIVPVDFLTALGNTTLRPETSRELEGGMDAALWNDRLQVTASLYNKTRTNAIISLPVAASVLGDNQSIQFNIGTVRNTGTELSMQAQVVETRTVGWGLGANWSMNTNKLMKLNSGSLDVQNDPYNGIVEGYPLFGRWEVPIVLFADANGNGVIEPSEIRYGDSLTYVGQTDPKYELNVTTDLSLFNGRLSAHATVAYQNGMTQFNAADFISGASSQLGDARDVPLSVQAAVVAAGIESSYSAGSYIGLIQTVNILRFQSLSVNYEIPPTIAQRFRVPRMSLALQGSNLGLHTNYRGIDPNVNAFSAGNGVQDSGQLPQPRTWTLTLRMGN